MKEIDVRILKAREIFKSIEDNCKLNGIKYQTPYQVKDYLKFKSPFESPLDFNEKSLNKLDYISILFILITFFLFGYHYQINENYLYLIASGLTFSISIIFFIYSLKTKKTLKKEKDIYKQILEGTKLVESIHLKNIDCNKLNENDYFLNCKICSLLYKEIKNKNFDFKLKEDILKELNKEYKEFDKNEEFKIISKKAINGLFLYKNKTK